MKKWIGLCLLCFHLMACSQSRNIIRKAMATYKVYLPGAVAVDSTGNEIVRRDTTITLFVETTQREINWDAAWGNGKTFKVDAGIIKNNQIDVGKNKKTGERVFISSAKGNLLWKLKLFPALAKSAPPHKINSNEILLKGISKGKSIYKTITLSTELASKPRY